MGVGGELLFSPSGVYPLDLSEGVMRCLEDENKRLLWKGVWEACLGGMITGAWGHLEAPGETGHRKRRH